MNTDSSNDDPRDAHLLAALRHAPDRDALPPREVSERILAAARAAVRPAGQSRAPWRQRLGAWLAQPQVAAAFGTLAVASLVGVMWSTREPPVAEFVPPPPAERVEQDAMAATPPAAPKVDAAAAESGAVAAAPAATGEVRSEAAQAPRPTTPPSRSDTAARAESRSRVAPEAPPAPAAATAPAAPAPAPRVADAPAPTAAAQRRSANESESPVLARQQGAAAPGPSAMVGAEATRVRMTDPMTALDAALAAGARWRVTGLSGARQHGDAQRAFWASVREATQGQWAAVQPVSPTTPWLVLEHDSQGALLWIMNEALHVNVQGQSWRAPVDAARLVDWQAQVARW